MNKLVDLSGNTTRNRFDPSASSCVLSVINFNVKSDKQNQVRRENTAAGVGSSHETSTIVTDRENLKVLRELLENDLLIGGEVDET